MLLAVDAEPPAAALEVRASGTSHALRTDGHAEPDDFGHTSLVDEELTDEELGRIEARANASLPAPWKAFVEGRNHWGGDDFIRTGGLDDAAPDMYVMLSYWDDAPAKPADATVLDFIASARQDVPRLVAEVRRLRQPPAPV